MLIHLNKKCSAVCLVALDSVKPNLYTSYIGDAGYLIFRREENKLVQIHRSQEHIHVS